MCISPVYQSFYRGPSNCSSKPLRVTLTLDNGKEFARFKDIESGAGLAIYFADPYSAWQRGTNENTHGLRRRYFPKGTDFRKMTDQRLASAVKKLTFGVFIESPLGQILPICQ